jgi:hypothetical protein
MDMMASIAAWWELDKLGVFNMLTKEENTTIEEYSSLLVSAAAAVRSIWFATVAS